MLLLLFRRLAAAAKDVPRSGSFFTLEGPRTTTETIPLFFLREETLRHPRHYTPQDGR
ncbi:hypothetical protein [Streptomyces sp. NPDC046161]|uniref:hypothetical protein n=1 Tax=Streptomyces sp. NPDC046161 TaxID=3155132 RepID=UPI0033ECC967